MSFILFLAAQLTAGTLRNGNGAALDFRTAGLVKETTPETSQQAQVNAVSYLFSLSLCLSLSVSLPPLFPHPFSLHLPASFLDFGKEDTVREYLHLTFFIFAEMQVYLKLTSEDLLEFLLWGTPTI